MSIIQEPREIPVRFMQAWNKNSPQEIADLFFENADFINVTGKWWERKKEILKAHDFGLRVIFQDSKMEILRIKEKRLSKDIAVVHAHIRITGQTTNQEIIAENRETLFLFVVKKNNGGWLCESAQNTDINPGKQTYIRDAYGELKAVSYKEKKIKSQKKQE